MIVDGPRRFGEASLASVARELHLVPVVTAGLIAGILAFLWLEGRGRMAWRYAPLAMARASAAPYRQSSIVSRYLDSAPLAVRISALTTLVLASVLAPLALLALFAFPFDGVAIPLMPGVAFLVLNAVAAWRLLSRSPHARTAAQSGANGSLIISVGMVCIGAGHLLMVEMQRNEGIEHACSASVTFVCILFALGSGAQALLTLAALRMHGGLLAPKSDDAALLEHQREGQFEREPPAIRREKRHVPRQRERSGDDFVARM
jgi:hypothetical protein